MVIVEADGLAFLWLFSPGPFAVECNCANNAPALATQSIVASQTAIGRFFMLRPLRRYPSSSPYEPLFGELTWLSVRFLGVYDAVMLSLGQPQLLI